MEGRRKPVFALSTDVKVKPRRRPRNRAARRWTDRDGRIGNLSYVGAEGQMQRAADQWEMTNKNPDGTQHLSVCVCVRACASARFCFSTQCCPATEQAQGNALTLELCLCVC